MVSGPEHIGSILADMSGEAACHHCGATSDDLTTTLGPHRGGHYARLDCDSCGAFVKWIKKPDALKRAKRSRKGQAALLARDGRGECLLCNRAKEEIPAPGTLHAHHVREVQDGGGDEPENIWVVCSHCHSMIHLVRTYFGHYHQKPEVTT